MPETLTIEVDGLPEYDDAPVTLRVEFSMTGDGPEICEVISEIAGDRWRWCSHRIDEHEHWLIARIEAESKDEHESCEADAWGLQ